MRSAVTFGVVSPPGMSERMPTTAAIRAIAPSMMLSSRGKFSRASNRLQPSTAHRNGILGTFQQIQYQIGVPGENMASHTRITPLPCFCC